ncbi:alpha/beta fold hydrolase [Halorussus sp. MSC15.2]|uniref:alpha/beta fold hydrolase n=1 Tax=Halorussus sp. MSC15.2 TaxID=2283638 RepID=UPI0035C8D1C9
MGESMSDSPTETDRHRRPDWLDRTRYPFDANWLDLPEGRVHYADEGEGRPVVMLHGNPTWSFLYRHLLGGLSDEYRCVVPDLLGFGLSEKPSPSSFSYRPADHARVVERLFDALDLQDAVVVGHDWGGPLGLDYATRNPDAVSEIVLMNTWMWPRERLLPRIIGRTAANPVGNTSYSGTTLSPGRQSVSPTSRVSAWTRRRTASTPRRWGRPRTASGRGRSSGNSSRRATGSPTSGTAGRLSPEPRRCSSGGRATRFRDRFSGGGRRCSRTPHGSFTTGSATSSPRRSVRTSSRRFGGSSNGTAPERRSVRARIAQFGHCYSPRFRAK